ncbi:MAG TPA: hypothetical protein VK427_21405, partial [Kofleriaceae bacterium]|nr:hypothetical protein [Kofleriaceae bacterium]
MRVTFLAAVLGLGLAGSAAAEPMLKKPIVWKDRVIPATSPAAGEIPLTSVSHTLYLNDCFPNGCTVSPGNDNSIQNRSSIAESVVVLNKYPHGTEHWNKLVQCVKDTFKPFQINVVTADPGTANHFEVMIGGADVQLNPELSAGGVAPYVSCNAQRDNGLSFVFPETTSDLEYLCGAVVQEACHVWGLDHELNAKDPMTYLDLGSLKRFQNDDANCGEELGRERRCRCGGSTQNSFRYMNQTFGLDPTLAAPTLEVTTPREGAWVKPAFPIGAILTSPLDAVQAEIKIDGTVAGMMKMAPFVINAPASVTPGKHTVTVSASDAGDRTATATVNVNVMASCAGGQKCPSNTHCLGGLCLPGTSVDGGLGAECTDNAECVTGSCGVVGSESKCTATCDAGMSCPSGYDCLDAGNGSGVCWP